MAQTISDMLNPWDATKIPDLSGKVAVVTGGNEGIGAAFCTELLKNNIFKVIIASNDAARHKDAMKHFSKEAGKDVSSKVTFHEMDLGDYDAVRKVVEQIKKETDRIDILDLSAAIGIYKTDIPESTNDKSHALDRHFAVNNVGHAIFAAGLLDLVKQTGKKTSDARIVVMASNLHFSADSSVKWESIEEINTHLGPTLQYNRSKMGNVLFAKKLARNLAQEGYAQQVFVNSIHPGVVKTAQQDGALETYVPKIQTALGEGVVGTAVSASVEGANLAARTLLMKDSPAGALSALYAATSPEVREKGLQGEYIVPNGTVQTADKRALDEKYQDKYWELLQECIRKGYGNSQGADHQEGSTARGSATI
ncbi:hypothetical protein HYFRA_00006631 [Hymenoscyphus fraxineus]|uniref:NAD(P)-binding protein n=1 Tax=Hymenoscyphus fraxineus TaxID=746836 RepID=A0A9N9KU54_9HELO|nr:hypothetical protein HYFRA_00006631 [Hymenoscyphus fraxineus]